MKHIVPHWGPEMQYDAVSLTVAEIDEAIPIRIYPRAVDPRAEREAKPAADESGTRRRRQEGGRRPGEGVCAADGARRSRRQRRRRRGRLAFNACHPVEAQENDQPDAPGSTSWLRQPSHAPTCVLHPLSHRSSTRNSPMPRNEEGLGRICCMAEERASNAEGATQKDETRHARG